MDRHAIAVPITSPILCRRSPRALPPRPRPRHGPRPPATCRWSTGPTSSRRASRAGLHRPDAWRIGDRRRRPVLEQYQASKYEPKVRSPFNIALIEGLDVWPTSCSTCRSARPAATTATATLCLFFSHQDPSHFYYVHLGKEADPHANSIFLVNDEPRVSIAKERTTAPPGTTTGTTSGSSARSPPGTIAVYFDDMETPS